MYCIPGFSRSSYFRGFRGWSSVRVIRNYSSLVKAESRIRENKNPRIAKIAQTRKLGDREKNGITVYYFQHSFKHKLFMSNLMKLALDMTICLSVNLTLNVAYKLVYSVCHFDIQCSMQVSLFCLSF